MSWGLAYRLCEYLLIRDHQFNRKFIAYFIGIFISSWIGAKILFLIVTKDVQSLVSESSFWLGGGFVFLGGFILGTIFTLLAIKPLKMISWSQIKSVIPAIPLSHALGRVGCFMAGCCYGKPWHTHIVGVEVERYPVQLMESFGLFLIGLWLWKIAKYKKDSLISNYLLSYGALRFFLEYLRGDDIRGVYSIGLSTSQIVSIVLIAIGIILKLRKSKEIRP